MLETAAISLACVAEEKLQDISGSSDILLKHLESHSSLRVRFACARALVNGDLKESAAAVLKMDESANDAQRLWLDPALAHWKFAPAADVWTRRLVAENETTVAVSLACDGLAALGDPQVSDLLLAVLHDNLLPYEKRRAAAQAICVLAPDIALAEAKLLTAGSVLERLLGVELLSSENPDAHAGLFSLCTDASEGVASAAWMALFRFWNILAMKCWSLRHGCSICFRIRPWRMLFSQCLTCQVMFVTLLFIQDNEGRNFRFLAGVSLGASGYYAWDSHVSFVAAWGITQLCHAFLP